MPTEALALIDEATAHTDLNELARRARAILASPEPTEADGEELARYFRQQRAVWGAKRESEKNG